MAVTKLSQQDFLVRLQLSNCCIGEKTAVLLSKIKTGAKDVNCRLQDLQVMQGMIKHLKCYDTTLVEVLATGTVEINVIPADSIINIYINGISISGNYTRTSATQSSEMVLLTALINSYQSTYTAIYDASLGSFGKIVITSPTCDNLLITTVVTNATVTVTGLTGTCLTENCITEEEMQSMFEYISKKCNLCFQPANYVYQ